MTREAASALKQLSAIVTLLVVGYLCRGRLRFRSDFLNLIFFCCYRAAPFFAIQPLLHLPRAPKIIGLVLVSPLLLFSSFLLLGRALGFTERTETLQTFQLGGNTIDLQRYENGGALGIHGINLEQRRTILPGLYLVRSVAFFDDAKSAVFFMEQPYVFEVHATGNYGSNDYQVAKICRLKPWVYF